MTKLYLVTYTTVAYVHAESEIDAIEHGEEAKRYQDEEPATATEVKHGDFVESGWSKGCLVYHGEPTDVRLEDVWPGGWRS